MSDDPREFFSGDREVDRFSLPFHRDKAQLECRIVERWDEVLYHVLKCGNKLTKKVTRRLGLVRKDQVELESAVKAGLGLPGIAEFATAIKSRANTELRLEESTEEEEVHEFAAPKCGRLTVLVYQLMRRWELRYEDGRFLHRDAWTKTFIDWQHRFHDASKTSDNDPDCGCSRRPDTGADGFGYLALNGLSMIVPYRKRAEGGLEFPGTGLPIVKDTLEQHLLPELKLAWLPGYLKFLSGENRAQCDALLRPSQDAEVVTIELPLMEVDVGVQHETTEILKDYERLSKTSAMKVRALIEQELRSSIRRPMSR